MTKKDLEILKKRFGEKILDIRMAKALSLREMASQCALDNSKISKIEKGKINVSLATLVELARGLGVPPPELLHGDYDWAAQAITNTRG